MSTTKVLTPKDPHCRAIIILFVIGVTQFSL